MKPIKEMDNLKKETKKALKKLYKNLQKRDAIITEESKDQAMRHTPTEDMNKANEKFRKFLVKQEKFILIDIATILDIGKEKPKDAQKLFKTNKQVRVESKTFKQVLNEIIETKDLQDTLDEGLSIIDQQKVNL